MAGGKCENWTLEELSNALMDMHKENKRIVVLCFSVENVGKNHKNISP